MLKFLMPQVKLLQEKNLFFFLCFISKDVKFDGAASAIDAIGKNFLFYFMDVRFSAATSAICAIHFLG